MPRPYDDDRYLQWYEELRALVTEFLDTEGNNADALRVEVDNLIEDFDPEDV